MRERSSAASTLANASIARIVLLLLNALERREENAVKTLDADYTGILRDHRDAVCLSLYQPTHRHHPASAQDPIRYGNLVRSLEESLKPKLAKAQIDALLEPFRALTTDPAFWNNAGDGLAVLGSANLFRAYRLRRPVPQLAIVAGTFHLKPLMRILQSADRYHVLALSRKDVRLFEGNRDVLDEVALADGVPRTIVDALGDELTEPHLKVSSYGGAGKAPMHHGHGDRASEVDLDAERYFRALDRAVMTHHSQPAGIPLILAALPQHHHMFHSISHNPALLADSLDVHPESLPSLDALRQRAWQLMEPRYLARLAGLVESFGNARSKGQSEADLANTARAVVAGRVATLLIEADRVIPGRVEPDGALKLGDPGQSGVDDVLDDLGTLVQQQGGEVVIVPAGRMPTDTGLAAIFRY